MPDGISGIFMFSRPDLGLCLFRAANNTLGNVERTAVETYRVALKVFGVRVDGWVMAVMVVMVVVVVLMVLMVVMVVMAAAVGRQDCGVLK